MSRQDLAPATDESPPAEREDRKPWTDRIGEDLEKELGARAAPLQELLGRTVEQPTDPDEQQSLRVALSAIRDNLDRETREWRGSAKVVEQALRQLASAEQERAAALDELARAEARVVRTGEALTEALASFDETGESRELDPRFAESDQALLDLDHAANELAITQHGCRAAWKAYEDALAAEQDLRLRIKAAAV